MSGKAAIANRIDTSGLMRPWYGPWPPEAQPGFVMSSEQESNKTDQKVSRILGGLFVSGAALVIIPELLPSTGIYGFLREVLPHFGIAALIAGILGLTVDRAMKAKFLSELATNVFKATIGYTLPEPFKKEMRWISSQKGVCIDHNQDVTIESNNETTVRVTCKIIRKIQNISGEEIEEKFGLAIDEWFFDRWSKILEFGYQIEGQSKVELTESHLNKRHMDKNRPVVSVKRSTALLQPNSVITVWMKFFEIKPMNSDIHNHFSVTTINPRVSVRAPDGIGFVVAFPRETKNNKEIISDTFTYKGTLLTGQEIRVRWWDEDKINPWIGSGHNS